MQAMLFVFAMVLAATGFALAVIATLFGDCDDDLRRMICR